MYNLQCKSCHGVHMTAHAACVSLTPAYHSGFATAAGHTLHRVPPCTIQQAHRELRWLFYGLNRVSSWSSCQGCFLSHRSPRPPKACQCRSRDQHAAARFSWVSSASRYMACSAEIRACGALCGAQVTTMVASPPTRKQQALMPHGHCRRVSRGLQVAVPLSQPCWSRPRQQLVRVGAGTPPTSRGNS
jgi:hypothetical protein